MTATHRIGLVTPGWPGQNTPNGIATSVYFLAKGLHEIGHPPVILTSNIDGPCDDDIPVIPIRDLRWSLQSRLRARFWDTTAETQRHIAHNIAVAIREASETHGLDVVLIEETHGWAAMVQRLVSVPLVVVLHGPWMLHKTLQSNSGAKEDMRREARESHAFREAAGLIAPSQNVLDAVQSVVSLTDKPKIVLPNTLLVTSASPLPAEKMPCEILFVGRFDLHKGGDIVLEAFARLVETHPHACLTFAGPDRGIPRPDGTTVNLANFLSGLPNSTKLQVTYKGQVDRSEVARLRSEHAIAVIASRYENLNYTLLEAMAAGQAIVSTNVGGPAEILENEQTALLVPSEDPAAMAAALGRLMDDEALRRRLGDTARASVAQDFNPARIARKTLRFLDTVLKG